RDSSTDPVADMSNNPLEFIARGSERGTVEKSPFDSDSDDSADPLVLNVILEKFEQIDEPKSYREAMSGPYAEYWQLASEEEVGALCKFGTWELVEKPKGVPVLSG
ncbi:hypothetical protein HDU93_003830, partial [Gonapodya sp. JEL0774]